MSTINLRKKNGNVLATHYGLTEDAISCLSTAVAYNAQKKISVEDVFGMSAGTVLLIGDIGTNAEIGIIDSITDLEVTLVSNLKFDHQSSTKVTVLPYDTVELGHSTSEIIVPASVTSVETRVIEARRPFTALPEDPTKTTGYYTARFVLASSEDSGGDYTVYSSWCRAMPVAGNGDGSVESIVMGAIPAGNKLDDEYCREEDLIRDANDAQKLIIALRDWQFEQGSASVTAVEGMREFDASALNIKGGVTKQSVLSVSFGGVPLDYVDYSEIEDFQSGSDSTTVASNALVGATSVVLTNSTNLADSGEVYVVGFGVLAYSANNKGTNTLTVSALATQIDAGTVVWASAVVGTPARWSIYGGSILLDAVVDENAAGKAITMKILVAPTPFDSFQSVSVFDFWNIMTDFVAARIEQRKGNTDKYGARMGVFNNELSLRSAKAKTQSPRTYSYSNR